MGEGMGGGIGGGGSAGPGERRMLMRAGNRWCGGGGDVGRGMLCVWRGEGREGRARRKERVWERGMGRVRV